MNSILHEPSFVPGQVGDAGGRSGDRRRGRRCPDPTPFFAEYGNNTRAAVKTYQDAQAEYAAAPVIK